LLHPLRQDDGGPRPFAGAASGGKGFFVEDPKNLKSALDEAMNHRRPALVNVVISQGKAAAVPLAQLATEASYT
jgi:thiamine pyrophosphate-dependent acetolactate synthase large subunit-like protein